MQSRKLRKNTMTKLRSIYGYLVILPTFMFFLTILLPKISFGTSNVDFCNSNIRHLVLFDSKKDSTFVIVIDPGHGGKDGGTSHNSINEKVITLQISKYIKRMIESNQPNIDVKLTRYEDVFVALNDRIDFSIRQNADLFISIHCNSYSDERVKGTEVYSLGIGQGEHLDIATRENNSVLWEDDFENKYDWIDPNSIEAHIFLSAFQSAYFSQSIDLANKVNASISKKSGTKNRGVKQAGFVILKNPTSPSILVEVGYLSNKSDRKKMTSTKGQKQIAQGISDAILSFINEKSLLNPVSLNQGE